MDKLQQAAENSATEVQRRRAIQGKTLVIEDYLEGYKNGANWQSQSVGANKQGVLDVMESRYKDFSQKVGHAYSAAEVRRAIEIVKDYFPDDYFENNPATPVQSQSNNNQNK